MDDDVFLGCGQGRGANSGDSVGGIGGITANTEFRPPSLVKGDAQQILERVTVIVPTLNAEPHLGQLLPAIAAQGLHPEGVLNIDSSSSDSTAAQFRDFGARVMTIAREDFNHGGTRRMAVENIQTPFAIFMTQDALPAASNTFATVLKAFEDPQVGMAYGRQLPRDQARSIERHARLFNYPGDASQVRSFADRERLGLKAVFCSNSFAAYRIEALNEVGGFPEDVLFAEDQVVSARMLKSGWKLAYVSEAAVIHSHDYSPLDEFRRYFDVGVFHARNPWLLDTYGKAEGEGFKFVQSELTYLWAHEKGQIGSAVLRTLAKYGGYRLGLLEKYMAPGIKQHLSLGPYYWRRKQ